MYEYQRINSTRQHTVERVSALTHLDSRPQLELFCRLHTALSPGITRIGMPKATAEQKANKRANPVGNAKPKLLKSGKGDGSPESSIETRTHEERIAHVLAAMNAANITPADLLLAVIPGRHARAGVVDSEQKQVYRRDLYSLHGGKVDSKLGDILEAVAEDKSGGEKALRRWLRSSELAEEIVTDIVQREINGGLEDDEDEDEEDEE
ncbi:hypothetical protein D9611_005949 [Ephemerocybe angulata]|uniref:Uncharacterized protein n=1 Tax=Ephemerocybe angulata TaxID=980116 RepID=A0A8H5CG14_9AGAR|nr:hypothetical protein D9611_005949 [Tulosesus angulatus]